jgi:hypothetical protein
LLGENSSALDVITIEGLREDSNGARPSTLREPRSSVFPADRSLQLTEALILSDLRKCVEGIELSTGCSSRMLKA